MVIYRYHILFTDKKSLNKFISNSYLFNDEFLCQQIIGNLYFIY